MSDPPPAPGRLGEPIRRPPRPIRPGELEVLRGIGRAVMLNRRRRNLDPATLAGYAGISRTKLRNIESARVAADVAVLSAIASRFGLTLCQLLCDGADQAERDPADDDPS